MSKQRKQGGKSPRSAQPEHRLAPQTAGRGTPQFQATVQTYTGPLPHPDILARYEEVVPGSNRIIFEQFVRQT